LNKKSLNKKSPSKKLARKVPVLLQSGKSTLTFQLRFQKLRNPFTLTFQPLSLYSCPFFGAPRPAAQQRFLNCCLPLSLTAPDGPLGRPSPPAAAAMLSICFPSVGLLFERADFWRTSRLGALADLAVIALSH